MTANRRPVIVGVDGSPAGLGAVRWAADEAVRHGKPLRITHALGVPGPFEQPFEQVVDEHDIALDAATEARGWYPGLHITTSTWHGSPAHVLVEESRHASLVVVGSRRTGGFRSLLVGSVGLQLAARAYCPVLIVHNAERWAAPESPLPRQPIVVGFDGSAHSDFAVGLAFSEAATRGVELVAVRAWREQARRWGRGADLTRLAAAVRDALAADLEPWQAKYPTVPVGLRAVRGTAAPVLLAEGSDALMVVLGPRGRGGLDDVRLGSVTQQVLDHASIPVLIAQHA
ncbi:universal stress protein [Dactylosporangium roseum]|uniref:Universal stress protein n=1 Tax=Dactylosporangium roseum TaxID=47989 RepID=A0ABY5YXA1_9ACTN|nr:universal stress protein [Dactylosporangium roseum]UWZ34157.1 universal stress protein [Dactylosporangium roseum]